MILKKQILQLIGIGAIVLFFIGLGGSLIYFIKYKPERNEHLTLKGEFSAIEEENKQLREQNERFSKLPRINLSQTNTNGKKGALNADFDGVIRDISKLSSVDSIILMTDTIYLNNSDLYECFNKTQIESLSQRGKRYYNKFKSELKN